MADTRPVQCCVWDVSIPAAGNTHLTIIDVFKRTCKKYSFQRETGESGYDHYQCRVSLKVKQRTEQQAARVLEGIGHVTRTSTENRDNNFYVTKTDTRTEGPWKDTDPPPKVWPWHLKGKLETLRPWQVEVRSWQHIRNDRWIDVIHDITGKTGKSTLARLLEFIGEAYSLDPGKNTDDMCADLCDELMDAGDFDPRLLFIDCERAGDQKHMAPIYAAIERIKGGRVKDRRYKLRKIFFGSPNVVVFCNRLPQAWQVSRDRWRYWTISQDTLVRLTDAEVRERRLTEAQDDQARAESEQH